MPISDTSNNSNTPGYWVRIPQRAALVYLVEPMPRGPPESLVMLMLPMQEAYTERAHLERASGAMAQENRRGRDTETEAGVHGRGPTGGFFEGGSIAGVHAVSLGQGPAILAKGDVEVTGDIRLFNADCAEDFDIAGVEAAEPGTVMVLGEEGALRPSDPPTTSASRASFPAPAATGPASCSTSSRPGGTGRRSPCSARSTARWTPATRGGGRGPADDVGDARPRHEGRRPGEGVRLGDRQGAAAPRRRPRVDSDPDHYTLRGY